MKRYKVKSSNLHSIGYDSSTQTLEVEFNTGQVYKYMDVPQDVYNSLMTADSHGEFFGKYVRKNPKYRCEKV